MTMSPAKAGEPTVHRWADLACDRPMDLLERRRIIGSNVMLSMVRLEKGCVVPEHSHANEQVACVLSGRLRFSLRSADGAAWSIDLCGGDALHLPPLAPHAAVAVEETVVLDIFSPPSEKTGIDRS